MDFWWPSYVTLQRPAEMKSSFWKCTVKWLGFGIHRIARERLIYNPISQKDAWSMGRSKLLCCLRFSTGLIWPVHCHHLFQLSGFTGRFRIGTYVTCPKSQRKCAGIIPSSLESRITLSTTKPSFLSLHRQSWEEWFYVHTDVCRAPYKEPRHTKVKLH